MVMDWIVSVEDLLRVQGRQAPSYPKAPFRPDTTNSTGAEFVAGSGAGATTATAITTSTANTTVNPNTKATGQPCLGMIRAVGL